VEERLFLCKCMSWSTTFKTPECKLMQHTGRPGYSPLHNCFGAHNVGLYFYLPLTYSSKIRWKRWPRVPKPSAQKPDLAASVAEPSTAGGGHLPEGWTVAITGGWSSCGGGLLWVWGYKLCRESLLRGEDNPDCGGCRMACPG
jgi:hypothetical protein